MGDNYKDVLHEIYYNAENPAGYSGISRVLREIRKRKGYENIKCSQVKDWLESQKTYTLHVSARHKFKRSPYINYSLDFSWSIDLAYAPKNTAHVNKGINYILVCMENFSQFLWTRPMKNKLGITTATAMLDIIKTSERHPQILISDAGTEFVGKQMRELVLDPYNIYLHVATTGVKAAYAELYIRLLKRKIYRYMTAKNTKKWLEKLDDFTNSLNT